MAITIQKFALTPGVSTLIASADATALRITIVKETAGQVNISTESNLFPMTQRGLALPTEPLPIPKLPRGFKLYAGTDQVNQTIGIIIENI